MIKNKQTFNIRETAEILVPDKFGRTSYLIAISLIMLMVGIITLVLAKLPNFVPMYFTLPWGEARLAPKQALYLLPGLSMAVLLLDLMLGRLLRQLSPLLPRILFVTVVVVSLMMTIGMMSIIRSLVL